MNEEQLDKDVAKEVLTLLLYSSKNIQDKIPEDFIRRLTDKAADSDIEIHLDKDKNLKDQDISSNALDTFSLLYYLYVADDEEKDDILYNWKKNDKD